MVASQLYSGEMSVMTDDEDEISGTFLPAGNSTELVCLIGNCINAVRSRPVTFNERFDISYTRV